MLAKAIESEGFHFTYTPDPNELNAANLAKYDALMIYANHTTITPDQEKALLDFVNSGKGFLPIHCASFCFQNSPAYIALVGAQFLKHGTGEFTATIVQPNHPVLDGIQPFQVWDETYVHTKINPDKTVLMERVDDSGREPWTWVREQGKGRVFYTAYGHDERVWGHPMFQRLVRNGILWAVGPTVRNEWASGTEVRPSPTFQRPAAQRPTSDRADERAEAKLFGPHLRQNRSHEPETRGPPAAQDSLCQPGRHRVAGPGDRRKRGDLFAVRPDAPAAVAGRPARRTRQSYRRPDRNLVRLLRAGGQLRRGFQLSDVPRHRAAADRVHRRRRTRRLRRQTSPIADKR